MEKLKEKIGKLRNRKEYLVRIVNENKGADFSSGDIISIGKELQQLEDKLHVLREVYIEN